MKIKFARLELAASTAKQVQEEGHAYQYAIRRGPEQVSCDVNSCTCMCRGGISRSRSCASLDSVTQHSLAIPGKIARCVALCLTP